jgi:hypothetical protein
VIAQQSVYHWQQQLRIALAGDDVAGIDLILIQESDGT